MHKQDWVEQRLLNWARWRLGAGTGPSLGHAGVSWGDAQAGRRGYREAVIPVNAAEASETDDAVSRLQPAGLRLAVEAWYCGQGGAEEKAAGLGIAVSTMHKRVALAHYQLSDHWLAQQDRQRAERRRVEALVEQARPGGVLHRPKKW